MRTTKAATHRGRGYTENLVEDLAVATLAGYLGTKAMEPVSMKLYELESADDRAREDHARPGPPYRVAAQKTTQLLGLYPTEQQLDQAALVFHYGLAVSWAPVYTYLRRRRLRPIPAGLVTGTAMSLVADEAITPALGFSAPNRAYPLSTHLRGLAATSHSGWPSPRPPKPPGACAAAAPDPCLTRPPTPRAPSKERYERAVRHHRDRHGPRRRIRRWATDGRRAAGRGPRAGTDRRRVRLLGLHPLENPAAPTRGPR